MTKIYIACPAAVATGGPELLHQLCFKLNEFGFKAEMYYYREFENDPVHDRFKKYNNPYVLECENNYDNIIIVPEVDIDLLNNYKKCKKIIWWLSVDNYLNKVKGKRYKIKHLFGLRGIKIDDPNILHFVQSEYAKQFLISSDININKIYYLSDYLSDVFIQQAEEKVEKVFDYVLYNPKKGIEFTKKIMDKSPHFKWIPLENLTPMEMSQLMKKSKVYIDFGNHPGKDRIPREAAISGCCIITGMKGSAKFEKDVPISNEYKYDDNEENIDLIIEKIEFLLTNYNEEVKKFENYRKFIREEEMKFEDDINYIFNNVLNLKK